MPWLTGEEMKTMERRDEERTNKTFLAAMGVSGVRRLFGMAGPALSVDEIAERLSRLKPGITPDQAKAQTQEILHSNEKYFFNNDCWYQFAKVHDPRISEEKHQLRYWFYEPVDDLSA